MTALIFNIAILVALLASAVSTVMHLASRRFRLALAAFGVGCMSFWLGVVVSGLMIGEWVAVASAFGALVAVGIGLSFLHEPGNDQTSEANPITLPTA